MAIRIYITRAHTRRGAYVYRGLHRFYYTF